MTVLAVVVLAAIVVYLHVTKPEVPQPRDRLLDLYDKYKKTRFYRRYPSFPVQLRETTEKLQLTGEALERYIQPYEEIIDRELQQKKDQDSLVHSEALREMFRMRTGN